MRYLRWESFVRLSLLKLPFEIEKHRKVYKRRSHWFLPPEIAVWSILWAAHNFMDVFRFNSSFWPHRWIYSNQLQRGMKIQVKELVNQISEWIISAEVPLTQKINTKITKTNHYSNNSFFPSSFSLHLFFSCHQLEKIVR